MRDMTDGSIPLVTMSIRIKILEHGYESDLQYDFEESYPIEDETDEHARTSYYKEEARWLAGAIMYSSCFIPGSAAKVDYMIVGRDSKYTSIHIGD